MTCAWAPWLMRCDDAPHDSDADADVDVDEEARADGDGDVDADADADGDGDGDSPIDAQDDADADQGCPLTPFEAGVTSREFLSAMESAVPGVLTALDGFASHSYPAEGEGWGFFVPYDRAGPGLHYYQTELAAVGLDLPVLMTETGWTTEGGHSRESVADWTVRTYEEVWLADDTILAVMPFMLRDAAWDGFGRASADGFPCPVYDAVRALRCASIPGRCP